MIYVWATCSMCSSVSLKTQATSADRLTLLSLASRLSSIYYSLFSESLVFMSPIGCYVQCQRIVKVE